jgi:hypothetical protein
MTRIVQEKFQIRPKDPKTDCDSCNWVGDSSARTKHGVTAPPITGGLNRLPPGTNLEDQAMVDDPRMPFSMGGATDVSRDYTESATRKGFTRKGMLSTDDEYTNEHTDTFYGEVDVDGDVGFAERGNLLDRL